MNLLAGDGVVPGEAGRAVVLKNPDWFVHCASLLVASGRQVAGGVKASRGVVAKAQTSVVGVVMTWCHVLWQNVSLPPFSRGEERFARESRPVPA